MVFLHNPPPRRLCLLCFVVHLGRGGTKGIPVSVSVRRARNVMKGMISLQGPPPSLGFASRWDPRAVGSGTKAGDFRVRCVIPNYIRVIAC